MTGDQRLHKNKGVYRKIFQVLPTSFQSACRSGRLFPRKRQMYQKERYASRISLSGTPERIRTAGLPLRRRTLYPAELSGPIDLYEAT